MPRIPDRFDVLDELGILDTPAEPEFDNLVIVARALCHAPVALISLVHRDRQWFKARSGFGPHETPLDQSVCVHAMSSTDILVIPDLTLDDRTRSNTLVTADPHIRFYAGVPLVMEGVAIGSFCVIDTVPRPDGLTEDQTDALKALAEQVITQLRSRQRAQRWMNEIEAQNIALRTAADQAMALIRLAEKLQAVTSQEEAVAVGSEIMAETLGATRAGFGMVDPDRETVAMQPEWRAVGVRSLAGVHNFRSYGTFIDDLKQGEVVIIQDVEDDPRTSGQARALLDLGIRVLINVPVFQQGRFALVGFVHYDWPRPLSRRDGTFIRTVADRIQSTIAQLRAVEDRRIMNQELSHRLKNTFAMITAIARQTFGSQNREALRTFSARLTAVGGAYDLLAHERWQAADMASVVTSAIAVAGGEERVRASGPAVSLGPEAALSVAMLLHELSTNAMKYGALSVPAGRVTILWTLEGESVTLHWHEEGGPPVRMPERTGFGSRLMQMGFAGNGDTDIDFAPAGLTMRVRATLEELAR